ncbi:hypothetical protein CLM76_06725 [Vreelandella venusta]|nr:hypothetical protein CLM76_06725 [Halomonas hydrothermalis]
MIRRLTLGTALASAMIMLQAPLLAAHHGGEHHEVAPGHVPDMVVSQPWSRATPPGAGAGGGFVTITNQGNADDTLVSASSPLTERVEIHTMEMDGDVMRMAQLPGGIEIPAGETVTLAPGGLHLMFMELASPIVEGQAIPVTLEFRHAEPVEITLEVFPAGESPEGGHHGDGHSHSHTHTHTH